MDQRLSKLEMQMALANQIQGQHELMFVELKKVLEELTQTQKLLVVRLERQDAVTKFVKWVLGLGVVGLIAKWLFTLSKHI